MDSKIDINKDVENKLSFRFKRRGVEYTATLEYTGELISYSDLMDTIILSLYGEFKEGYEDGNEYLIFDIKYEKEGVYYIGDWRSYDYNFRY